MAFWNVTFVHEAQEISNNQKKEEDESMRTIEWWFHDETFSHLKEWNAFHTHP